MLIALFASALATPPSDAEARLQTIRAHMRNHQPHVVLLGNPSAHPIRKTQRQLQRQLGPGEYLFRSSQAIADHPGGLATDDEILEAVDNASHLHREALSTEEWAQLWESLNELVDDTPLATTVEQGELQLRLHLQAERVARLAGHDRAADTLRDQVLARFQLDPTLMRFIRDPKTIEAYESAASARGPELVLDFSAGGEFDAVEFVSLNRVRINGVEHVPFDGRIRLPAGQWDLVIDGERAMQTRIEGAGGYPVFGTDTSAAHHLLNTLASDLHACEPDLESADIERLVALESTLDGALLYVALPPWGREMSRTIYRWEPGHDVLRNVSCD